jgi:hypothetical protein
MCRRQQHEQQQAHRTETSEPMSAWLWYQFRYAADMSSHLLPLLRPVVYLSYSTVHSQLAKLWPPQPQLYPAITQSQ